jgi:hypothetical protein
MAGVQGSKRPGLLGRLAVGASRRNHLRVFRRRPDPLRELPLERDDVVLMLRLLAEIRENTRSILRILDEPDGEEETWDEP